MVDITVRARELALQAHEGHRRTDAARTPYHIHLQQVAQIVEDAGGSAEEIAAALLHDAVEDTSLTLEEIRVALGDTVADLVDDLTDPLEFKGMPLLERKTRQAERIHSKSVGAKRVKMADQISNTGYVGSAPPVAWNTRKRLDYVEGARRIIEACRDAHPNLGTIFDTVRRRALAEIMPRV